jgi:hypothetical protein
MTESCLSSVLWASKTLAPAAPDMNHVAERLKLCLPMAAGLPIGGSGDFGISPFFRQLTDKPLLVSMYIDGVSDAKSHRGREISVQNLLAVRLPPRARAMVCPTSRGGAVSVSYYRCDIVFASTPV